LNDKLKTAHSTAEDEVLEELNELSGEEERKMVETIHEGS
jgi:hypothetical protein